MYTLSVVGIDPGYRTGVAVIQKTVGNLSSLAFLATITGTKEDTIDEICKVISQLETGASEVHCIVEQASFRGAHSVTKRGALINRACGEFFYGTLRGKNYRVCMKTPMEWKGNTPKRISHARTMKYFRAQLIRVYGSEGFDQLTKNEPDALDALGIAIAGLKNIDHWF